MAEGPVGRVGWDALWLPATVGPAWVGTPPPSTLVTRPAASGYRWVGAGRADPSMCRDGAARLSRVSGAG